MGHHGVTSQRIDPQCLADVQQAHVEADRQQRAESKQDEPQPPFVPARQSGHSVVIPTGHMITKRFDILIRIGPEVAKHISRTAGREANDSAVSLIAAWRSRCDEMGEDQINKGRSRQVRRLGTFVLHAWESGATPGVAQQRRRGRGMGILVTGCLGPHTGKQRPNRTVQHRCSQPKRRGDHLCGRRSDEAQQRKQEGDTDNNTQHRADGVHR